MKAWRSEMDAFVRAFAGAYIFGIPLLFTMEMWWIGEHLDVPHLLTFLAVALAANFGLTYAAGFKTESTFSTTIDETIDVVAVGIVAATAMLLTLNQVSLDERLPTILGKIALQAVPLSIGASVANQVFGTSSERHNRQGEEEGEGAREALEPWQGLFSDVGATAIGGVFIGASIAPTEEIPMIAAALDSGHVFAIVAFSLLVSYGIVFASGFDGQQAEGPFQHPFTETMLAYVISLLVSFGALLLFGQVSFQDPMLFTIEQVIVLGVPTTVGGAAGRLVV